MSIYTKINGTMRKIDAIKTKHNGVIVDIKRIMTKINGSMVTIFQHITTLIKEFFGYPLNIVHALAGNLINWKLYGNTKQQLLPDGYTQLEYIEGTGTQYINTGITVLDSDEVKLRACVTTTGSVFMFSQGLSTTNTAYQLANASTDNIVFDIENYNPYRITSNVSAYNVFRDIHIKNKELFIDGVSQGVSTGTLSSATETLKLMYISTTGVAQRNKYSHFQVEGKINLISAKRNSDSAVGMYDLVTNTFFENAGTGSFVAGPVAPTPDVPVEIKSVGDKTVNLFDINKIYNGYILVSGTGAINANSNYAVSEKLYLKSGVTYTIKQKRNFGGTGDTLKAWSYNNADEPIARIFEVSGESCEEKTFICPDNISYIMFSYRQASSTNVMLVEGSTAPTSYVPYGYQLPVTVSGKNLFDKSKAVLGDISSTTGEPVSTFTYRFVSDFIKVNEGDKISFSGKMMYVGYQDEYDCSFIKAFYDSNKDFISGSRSTTTTPLTIPTGASYVRIEGYNTTMASGNTVVLDSLKVMLVEGSTAPTAYEPYHTPTTTPIYLSNPLRKVSTYADYIDYENQQVVRNVGYKVLTGTESWTKQEYATDNIGFRLKITDRVQLKDEVICSHYPYSNLISSNAPNNSIITFTSTNVDIKDNRFATADNFKAYLAQLYANNTPVVILYPLATPITEPLTVPALTMAEGTNIITTDTQIKPTDAYAKGYVSQL